MGVGGTNVAAVLAPPPAPTRPAAPARDGAAALLSARNRTELDALSRRLADALDRGDVSVADVAHTLRVGRTASTNAGWSSRRAGSAGRRVAPAPSARVAHGPKRGPPCCDRRGRAHRARSNTCSRPCPTGPRWSATAGAGRCLPDRVASMDPVGRSRRTAEGPRPVDEALVDGVAARRRRRLERSRRTPAAGCRCPPTRSRRTVLGARPAAPRRRPGARTRGPDRPGRRARDELESRSSRTSGASCSASTSIGLDDEFGALGGTSLLSVRMALEIQQRLGCLVNVHRAGGSRVTVRRMAEIVRAQARRREPRLADADRPMDRPATTTLVDADLKLPLGDRRGHRGAGQGRPAHRGDRLPGRVPAARAARARPRAGSTAWCGPPDEAAGWARLRAARGEVPAARARPEPGPAGARRPAGHRQVAPRYRDGELAARGRPRRALRGAGWCSPSRTGRCGEDNVLPHGRAAAVDARVRDPRLQLRVHRRGDRARRSARGPVPGDARRRPLDPRQGGYGVSKWVGERLLDRAEEDGMRVRVFRPGLIMASGDGRGQRQGPDLLRAGQRPGGRRAPEDDRALPMAPVDVVSGASSSSPLAPGSVGRAYHLVGERAISLRELFELLGDAGLATEPLPLSEWQELVRARRWRRATRSCPRRRCWSWRATIGDDGRAGGRLATVAAPQDGLDPQIDRRDAAPGPGVPGRARRPGPAVAADLTAGRVRACERQHDRPARRARRGRDGHRHRDAGRGPRRAGRPGRRRRGQVGRRRRAGRGSSCGWPS